MLVSSAKSRARLAYLKTRKRCPMSRLRSQV
jgi:hypothetical protein